MGLFSQPLIIDSPLATKTCRERIRELVSSRFPIGMPRLRWRQVLGWKLRERPESFLLEPNYLKSRNPVRFIGTVEENGQGSRVVGRVAHPWFTRIVMSIFIIFVAIAAVAGLAQHTDPPFKVIWISAVMLAGCVFLIRIELRSTGALIEAGLRAAVAPLHTLDTAD
jgi:hypothetical protein